MTLANILLTQERVQEVHAQLGPDHGGNLPQLVRTALDGARSNPSDVGCLVKFVSSLKDKDFLNFYVVNAYMSVFQAASDVPVEFRFVKDFVRYEVPRGSILSCPGADIITADRDGLVYAHRCDVIDINRSIGMVLSGERVSCKNGVVVGFDSIPMKKRSLSTNHVAGSSAIIAVRNKGGYTGVSRCKSSVVFVDASGNAPKSHPDSSNTGQVNLNELSLQDSILIVRSPNIFMHIEPETKYAVPSQSSGDESKNVVPPPGYRPKEKGWGEVICLDDFVLKDGIRAEKKLSAGRYNFPYWSRMGDVPNCVKGVGYKSTSCSETGLPVEYCVLPDGGIAVFGFVDNGRIVPFREAGNADRVRVSMDLFVERSRGIPLIYDDITLPRRVISPSPVADLRARINAELPAQNAPLTPNS